MPPTSRQRPTDATDTPDNTKILGVLLTVVAVGVAMLLFAVGGGGTSDPNAGKTAAEVARDSATTTTTSTTVPPTTPVAQLSVVIANGSGAKGRARTIADKLKTLGYTTIEAVDGNKTDTTVVYAAAGADGDAAALALRMGLDPGQIQAMPSPQPLKTQFPTAKVVVLVGPDFDPATRTIK
ncbi:MAG: LytR C-terminal domain-containing protein [Microthrixaceae bacterium]